MCGRRSAPARVIVCRAWKRRTSCPTGSSSSTITCRAARLRKLWRKRAACAECGRAAYRPNLRSRAGASPARRYPPRHHAGQYHPGSGWRASHRFRHCAHMVSVKQSLAGHHGAWHLWFRLARAIWLRQNRRAFRRVLAGPATRIHADRRISRCQRLRAATCR